MTANRENPVRGPARAEQDPTDEPPPVGSWRALYAVVLAGLVVMIALCAAITRWGARP